MPINRRTPRAISDPRSFFSRELQGETPPSLSTLAALYGLATKVYTLKPWTLLEESGLILTSDPATGETCYCGATGGLGEELAVRGYVGAESYRLLYEFAEKGSICGGDFITGQYSVGVEFVHKPELEATDKKLLNALGHPAAAKTFPIFRAVRPGYQPWFITEQEGLLLAECLRAVLLVCSALEAQPDVNYWTPKDTFPMVARIGAEGGKPAYKIEAAQVSLPKEPPLAPVQLGAEEAEWLRRGKLRRSGAIEADCFLCGMAGGGKYERKAWARLAMAADADLGLLLAPKIATAPTSAGEALGGLVLQAIRSSQALPREVRVRSQKFKDCLQPISDACGLPVKVVRKLPNLEEAKQGLMRMLGGSDLLDF